MITVTDLAMNYGGQTLFEGVNLQLDRGKRYGIVGANGAGKSTLLRILAGQESPSQGNVVHPRNVRLGLLEQDHFRYEDVRILDVVMMGNATLWAAMAQKEAMLDGPEEDFDVDLFGELEDIVQRHDGYGLESRAAVILEGLGIPTAQHEQPLSTLSGGYKLRVLMAQVLASDPDLLMLDEPTNHLDILAIHWLEGFLNSFRGCCVTVSHDHRFLDGISTHILDVDYERVQQYRGNYSAFVEQKHADRERMEAEIGKREKEIADHKAFIARFKAKASKARQANSRQKRLERIEIERLPQSSRRHPRFRFEPRRPSGREVLKVRGLEKSFGDRQVLHGVDLDVMRGERIAIVGPNGIGKSTLLKILVGELDADAGEFTWGHEADTGWFPQDHRELLGQPTDTVAESLWSVCPLEPRGAIYGRLAMVLFSRDDCDKPLAALSGGEAARVLFARLSVQQNTVLVLDEPTNHLDLEGIEALADALCAYTGTLLLVSHDRWFVDKVATRILALGPGTVDDFRGTWSEYTARSETTDHLDRKAVVKNARR